MGAVGARVKRCVKPNRPCARPLRRCGCRVLESAPVVATDVQTKMLRTREEAAMMLSCSLFEDGNLAPLRSGFFVDPELREEHRAELAQIGTAIAEALPDPAEPFALAVVA